MDGESKTVSWQFVTADALLAEKECELLYAYLVPSAANADATIYAGENTLADRVITLIDAQRIGRDFKPPLPVYCRKGLYVDIGSNVTGVLVMWRVL